MSMLTLAISCLTISNSPRFMDLAFQFLSDIVLYIIRLYFHHQTHPHLGIVSALAQPHSFLLELCLYSSPVAYWAPINLGSSCFSVLSFCLFMLFMGFSRQEYWSGLPFPSPVDHILSSLVIYYIVVSVSHVQLFAPHGLQHTRLPCPSLSPEVCLNSCPLSQTRLWSLWLD